MMSVVKITSPNGSIRMHAIRDGFADAFIIRDPFFWVVPGEVTGSIISESEPTPIPTERAPISESPATLRSVQDIPPDSI